MFFARAGLADGVAIKEDEVAGADITIGNKLVCGINSEAKLINAVTAERSDDGVIIESCFVELVPPPDERQLVFADDGARSVKELAVNDEVEPID